jgi:uncharacterized damage-inducible protein DinB
MNPVQTLTRYKAWADKLFLAKVAELPEAELTAPRPIVFGSIIRTLHHSYAMDRVWQAHLLDKPHGYTTRNPLDHPPLGELRDRQLEVDVWYVSYADSLDAAALAQVVHFTFVGGGSGSLSRNDILLHVVNHTTYHRGHVADMLYHHAIFPPTTDLPVFLTENRVVSWLAEHGRELNIRRDAKP